MHFSSENIRAGRYERQNLQGRKDIGGWATWLLSMATGHDLLENQFDNMLREIAPIKEWLKIMPLLVSFMFTLKMIFF